jgi:hypothetical protein
VAPQEWRLARSFLEALDIASWGQVAEARMNLGLLADGAFGGAIAGNWDRILRTPHSAIAAMTIG